MALTEDEGEALMAIVMTRAKYTYEYHIEALSATGLELEKKHEALHIMGMEDTPAHTQVCEDIRTTYTDYLRALMGVLN